MEEHPSPANVRERLAHAPEFSLASRLKQSFAKHAKLPAIEEKQSQLTYGELDRESAALAHTLAAAGVKPADIVPLFLRRSISLVVAEVALLRLGAAYAPIDLTSPIGRQQSMLDQLAPSVMVTDGHREPPNRAACAVVRIDELNQPAGPDFAGPWCEQPATAPAYVMFTSGTTGEPKGVVVPQSGVVRLVCDADYADMRPGARWGFLSSPAFDASTLEVWAPLFNGGCCIVQDEPQPSLDHIADFLRSRSITDVWLTSTLFSAMVEDRPDAFGDLHQVLTGGERVSPLHARTILDAYPELQLINGYGPTENTTFTLCHSISIEDTTNPNGIPIGKPIRGTKVRISAGHANDAEGELLAGGSGVALGYLNDAAATARSFVSIDDELWYRTGDQVRRRVDGGYEFMGRVDRQVKLQGQRIELDEVERAINTVPGVTQAVVVVKGESALTKHLVAFYTGHGASPPPRDVVDEHLRTLLPPGALPNVLVPLDELPRGINGKTDTAALEDWDVSTAETSDADKLLLGDIETRLAAIWQRLLPSASIHGESDFQLLGGTSLIAMQVSAQIGRQFGRALSPIEVLRTPVLREQALCIGRAAPVELASSLSLREEPHFPLSRAQQALLSSEQLVLIGAVDAPNVVVVFPGGLGPALGSYWLARELQRRLGEQHAVAILDLEAMLLLAPDMGLVEFLRERIEQVIMETIRAERVVGFAGFSVGGLFALQAADNRLDGSSVPVFLFDTYSPVGRVHRGLHQALKKAAKPVVRALYKSRTLAGLLHGRVPRPAERSAGAPATVMESLRSRVYAQLYREWCEPRTANVHLLQALEHVRRVGLLWNRATNGFASRRHTRWVVHHLHGSHDDLGQSLAADTAELVARELKRVGNIPKTDSVR